MIYIILFLGKPDTAQCQKLLTEHLVRLCQMNFLYLRLTLDLLEKRCLLPKSSGFKVIPINISEVFLLMCNLKFQTSSSFDRVRDILAVTLASLYPLKDEQIYRVKYHLAMMQFEPIYILYFIGHNIRTVGSTVILGRF